MSSRIIPTNKNKQVKSVAMAVGCHVCKTHGKPEHIIESHNFRDIRGNVCCPTILENVCSKCGLKGHLKSGCNRTKVSMIPRNISTKMDFKPEKTRPINSFDALADDMSDDELDPAPANVTIRKPLSRRARLLLNWADDSDDE